MGVFFSNALDDDTAESLSDDMNAALGASAVIEFRDGTMPADCETGDSGSLLASIPLNNPPWDAASGNTISLSAPSPSTVINSGTCTYWRMKNGSSVCHLQGTVAVGSVPDAIVFNTLAWTSSESIAVNAVQFTVALDGG